MVSKTVGPYKITEKIAFGGMGVVYKGYHTKLEQEVAIKVLSPQFSCNQEMKSKFLQEAKIQAKLSHPNVVNIMNYMEDEDETYLIMEFIDGETLEQILQRETKLSLDKAIKISLDILSALQYMHSKGLVHRDIKPSNIMLNKNGEVKVTDFGITKLIGDDKNTKSGLVGSYTYMSPEQILGEEVGIASDLYSFGITLFRMVTGHVPFKGNTEYSIMKGHLEGPRIPPWIVNPDLPRKLGKVIHKAISRNVKDRYKNAEEINTALENYNEPVSIFKPMEFNFIPYLRQYNSNILSRTKNLHYKYIVPSLLVLLIVAFTFIPLTTEKTDSDNLKTTSQSPYELINIDGIYEFYDVTWENVVSSIDSYLYGIDKGKNNKKIIKNKKRNNFAKNNTNDKSSPYPPQNYRYTNNNIEEEPVNLKNTLKRTKILPVQ